METLWNWKSFLFHLDEGLDVALAKSMSYSCPHIHCLGYPGHVLTLDPTALPG